jgi:hypothetical protein
MLEELVQKPKLINNDTLCSFLNLLIVIFVCFQRSRLFVGLIVMVA